MLAFQGEARKSGPQVGIAIDVGCGIDLPGQSLLEAQNTMLDCLEAWAAWSRPALEQ
jgi:hypothetical protein